MDKDFENVLSMRGREVLRLIDRGRLSKEIANELSISINTVNRHRQNILAKLNVDHAAWIRDKNLISCSFVKGKCGLRLQFYVE